MTGLADLERRVAQLDEGLGNPPASPDLLNDLMTRFIAVIQQVVDYGQPPALVSHVDADALQGNCRLLERIAGAAPQIVDGPLDVNSQYWIATGKPDHLPESVRTPRESIFVPASTLTRVGGAKPFGIGLFTSTGVAGDHGMWSRYLHLNRESSLHRLPWYTWQLQPDRGALVHEIASASAWVELLTAHPMPGNGLIHPDWASVARSYDAVHLTLRAITATQGFAFSTEHGLSAAAYWDIESTFWLRWCFQAIDLVEITD